MPFETRKDEPASKSIILRLTSAEKDRLKDHAEQAEMSMSEFIRRKCLLKPVLPDMDLKIINELRRIGIELRRISGGGGSESQVAEMPCRQEVISALRLVSSAISTIAEKMSLQKVRN